MPVRRLLPFTRSWSTPTLVAATVGALVVLVGLTSSGGIGLGPVVVIFAVWFFGFRNHGAARPVPPPEPTPFERAADAWRQRLAEQNTPGFETTTLTAPAGAPVDTLALAPDEQRWSQPYTDPAADLVVRDNEPPAVLADRHRRRRLWWLALTFVGVGVLAVTVLGLAGLPTGPVAYASAVLAGLGLTLLLAARSGRPPLLLPATIIAGLVTAATMGTAALGRIGYVGEYHRVVTASSDLPPMVDLSAGDVKLDLSRLQLAADQNLAIQVGAGSVDLNLPTSVNTEVTWKVKMGDFNPGNGPKEDGFDLSGVNSYPATKPGAATLHVTVDVNLGDVEVRP